MTFTKTAGIRTAAALIAATTLLVPLAPAVSASSAVEAALALPRDEPADAVAAILALVDLDAAEEAARVATELAAKPLAAEASVRLVERAGTASLVRLIREVPAAAAWAQRALDTATRATRDPKRLGGLVKQLTSDDEASVRDALRALRRTGPAGVAFCYAALVETDDATLRARLREALVALTPESHAALYAAAGHEDEAVRVEAYYALGRLAALDRLRSTLPVAIVTGPAVSEPGAAGGAARWAASQMGLALTSTDQATRRLDAAIDELLAGGLPIRGDADGRIAWPDADTFRPTPPSFVAKRIAARLADDRLAINPASSAARRQALVLGLESEPAERGDAETTPTHELSAALEDANTHGLYRAAETLCEVLGQRGDATALYAAAGGPSALAATLESPHPAVRFAALEAILAIEPTTPFAGSSRVAKSLAYFAESDGKRRAIVSHPSLADGGRLAGWLRASGYGVEPNRRNRDAAAAAADPDTELVLIDLAAPMPTAREALFRLRRTPATALLPVALVAPDGRLAEAERVVREHRGSAPAAAVGPVLATPRLHSAEAAATLVGRLAALTPLGWPDADRRAEQAEFARAAIARLAEEGPAFYRVAALRTADSVRP